MCQPHLPGALGHAQHRRAGARIGLDFGVGRLGLADQFHQGLRQVDGADRQAAVRLLDLGLRGQELLDHAVFQRMEADDRHARAGRQQFVGRAQTCFKVLKLFIDENPDSLKGAGGRILAFLPGFDRVCHDCGKLSCA
jgi:hypothetical protein